MLRISPIFGLVALFTPGFLTAASADVVSMDSFNVTLGPTTSPIATFNDPTTRSA
jgi:hypothetical protein